MPAFLTVLSGVNLPISFPSLSFTVTVPSSATSMFASAGRFGFASLTAFLTSSFSFGVKLDGLATSTGFAGATIAPCSEGFLAVSFPSSVEIFPASSVALALTSVPSFTLSAGIVTTPDAGSIFRPLSAGSDQLP